MRQMGVVWVVFLFAAASFATGPNVVVTAAPKGMVQTSGGPGASDTFTIANTGDANAVLTFQRNGNFFTLGALSAALVPGATQTVAINGTTQSGQAILIGSVTISGSGVPQNGISLAVRLMVASLPSNNPTLVAPEIPGGAAAQPGLVGFIIAAGNQPVSGAAPFRNSGTGDVLGMAVTNTAWLAPQPDFVAIGALSRAQVTFTIDPSKRPDAPAPLGAVTGTLSLRYLTGTSSSSTSISIVSVVRPDVAAGEAPPLAAGEVALFIPGLAYRGGVFGDLFLSARRGDPRISDLRLYYARDVAGSASLLAQIAQPPGSLAISFPSVVASVFGSKDQVGSIQMRGGATSNISVAAMQIADPGDGRVFFSPLPVLRSDRSIATGETLLLTGVERSNTLSTSLYVQEMSGAGATVQSDFFDAAGAAIGNGRTDSVGAFRALELLDVVPAGARSIRITNLGGGKIGAVAVLSDNATSAAWPLVDSSRAAPPGTTTWVIPVVVPPLVVARMDVFVANKSATAVPVTLESYTPSPPVGRRRAVHALGTATVQPLETQRTAIALTSGLLRLSAPAGTITAAGRLSMTASDRVGSFGASLPIVPLSDALGVQQGTRFTGVDDIPSGMRTSLILAEVGGFAVTVRVTLRYVFVAGQAVSSQAISTRDFDVAPGQTRVIPDIAASVIGSLRDTIGDLRNMQLDVDVTAGAGHVLPFVQSVNPATGSIVIRSQ